MTKKQMFSSDCTSCHHFLVKIWIITPGPCPLKQVSYICNTDYYLNKYHFSYILYLHTTASSLLFSKEPIDTTAHHWSLSVKTGTQLRKKVKLSVKMWQSVVDLDLHLRGGGGGGGGGAFEGLIMNVEFCEDNAGRAKKMRYLYHL